MGQVKKKLVTQVQEMYEQGYSVAEIAQRYQISHNVVEYVLEVHGHGPVEAPAANTEPGQ
jgi:orotate phosphoribosyltransferase-like protein